MYDTLLDSICVIHITSCDYPHIRTILRNNNKIARIYKSTMRNTLFYTTMTNHRPSLGHNTTTTTVVAGRTYTGSSSAATTEPRQFRATAARDPSDPSPNIPAQPVLRDMLARSTQPIFSVSAMFRMKVGGGCGSCGH